MTAPALARGQTGRRYVWPPNTDRPELVVPSVTTILGNLNKPALVNWAAKAVAEYAVENVLKWQELPSSDAVDLLKRAPYRNMTKKGDIGTAVHTAMETWDGKEVVVEDMDLLPYVGAAVAFLEDHADKVLEAEATIFNRTFLYAGTCDAIISLKDGRVAIVDYKTGKAVYSEAALQLCAYANGEFIGEPDGNITPLPTIDVGIVIHLPGDGTYKAHEVELTPRLWRTFQALRTVQKWRDDFEADALGKTHKGGDREPLAKTEIRRIKSEDRATEFALAGLEIRNSVKEVMTKAEERYQKSQGSSAPFKTDGTITRPTPSADIKVPPGVRWTK